MRTHTLLALLLTIPLSAVAADQPDHIRDVKLQPSGTLYGIAVNDAGQAKTGDTVKIRHRNVVIATVKTDERGRFAVRGLRPGVHMIQTKSNQVACRLWPAKQAPPEAAKALILSTNAAVRGQVEDDFIDGTQLIGLGSFAAITAFTIVSTVDSENDSANFGSGSGAGGQGNNNGQNPGSP